MPDSYRTKVLRETRQLCKSFGEIHESHGLDEAVNYIKSELSGRRNRFKEQTWFLIKKKYPEVNIDYD